MQSDCDNLKPPDRHTCHQHPNQVIALVVMHLISTNLGINLLASRTSSLNRQSPQQYIHINLLCDKFQLHAKSQEKKNIIKIQQTRSCFFTQITKLSCNKPKTKANSAELHSSSYMYINSSRYPKKSGKQKNYS